MCWAHPDDEVYVTGLLTYASRVLGKRCVIVSFMYSPAKTALNNASASYLGCEYVYLLEIDRGWEEKLRAVLDRYRPGVIVTFDPRNVFCGFKAHMAESQVVVKTVKSGYSGAKLYYVVNKDPAPVTDVLDLDAAYPGLGFTLWQAKLHVITIYRDAVPACRAVADNVGGIQDRMAHRDFYSADG